MWSRTAGEGQALPLHLPQHFSLKQEFPTPTLPTPRHENAAAKALGMPSNAQKLKSRILISIQAKNITNAKAPANGWKRGIPLSGFSRENWQKCQVQQSL